MITLDQADVEQKVIKVIKEIKDKQQIDGVVNRDWFPGSFIKSQILVTAIGRISRLLDIPIPNDCYPFYDKVKRCQLSIKEATQNIINALKKSK